MPHDNDGRQDKDICLYHLCSLNLNEQLGLASPFFKLRKRTHHINISKPFCYVCVMSFCLCRHNRNYRSVILSHTVLNLNIDSHYIPSTSLAVTVKLIRKKGANKEHRLNY